MINSQELVIYVIVAFCVLYVGNRVYHYFRGINNKENPCESCGANCELRTAYKKKQDECRNKSKEDLKKGCQ